jgi:hypothetical protein
LKPRGKEHELSQLMTPALLGCLHDPVRRQILRVLGEPGAALSPGEMFAGSISFGLTGIAYHTRVLGDRNVIRCTAERQVKGGTVRAYASNVSDNKLVREILRETEEDDAYLQKK